MTDEERFLAVLDEVHTLLLQLGDLKDKAVIIGGHVIALHALARHQSAAIQTTTETGVTVTRGFTHEPDVLFDLEADDFTAERLPEVLKARGYRRHRDFRWGREVAGGVKVEIDLFRSPELGESEAPLSMTPLADAATVLRRTEVPAKLGEKSAKVTEQGSMEVGLRVPVGQRQELEVVGVLELVERRRVNSCHRR